MNVNFKYLYKIGVCLNVRVVNIMLRLKIGGMLGFVGCLGLNLIKRFCFKRMEWCVVE